MKLKITIVALLLTVFTSCYVEVFTGEIENISNVELSKINSIGKTETVQIYRNEVEPDQLEIIYNGYIFEIEGEIKVSFKKTLYNVFNVNNISTENYDSIVVDCKNESYNTYNFDNYYIEKSLSDENSIYYRESLGDWIFNRYDSALNKIGVIDFSSYNDIQEIVKVGNNYYLLYKNSYSGYGVYIVDENINFLRYSNLNSYNVCSNFIVGNDSVSILSIDNVSFDGQITIFDLVENIITDCTEEKNIINSSSFSDLYNNSVTACNTKSSSVIYFIYKDFLYSYNSETNILNSKNIEGILDSLEENKSLNVDCINQNEVLLVYPNSYINSSYYIEDISVNAEIYDSEFNLVSSQTLELEKGNNREFLDSYVDSNNNIYISTFYNSSY